MPPVGFEPTMPARERPQTHALERAGPALKQCFALFLNDFNYMRNKLLFRMHSLKTYRKECKKSHA